ncbi:MAG: hypothetical protein JNM43_21345 [Planctomycetaceae bacterium]|nr:hypothetical protein [Planctomycetaceae bacterium]
MKTKSIVLPLLLSVLLPVSAGSLLSDTAQAREWSDSTGAWKFEGDLFAASGHTVVVRRKTGELQAYMVDQLCEADQEFVKKHMEEAAKVEAPEEMQTWEGRDGFKFRGKVIGYGINELKIKDSRGKILINDVPYEDADQLLKFMLPKIVAQLDDKNVANEEDFLRWARKQRKEKVLSVDGVMLRLEIGGRVAVPLFLFASPQREILEEGWSTWKHEATKEAEKERQSFLAQAQANALQQQQQEANQRIQMMQLEMLAVNAGITRIWEVQLIPKPGVPARPMSVVVSANSSLEAVNQAAAKYPGFTTGMSRQISYR